MPLPDKKEIRRLGTSKSTKVYMKNSSKITALVSSILLAAVFSTPAKAAEPVLVQAPTIGIQKEVAVPATAKGPSFAFHAPATKRIAAPVAVPEPVAAPEPVAQAPAPQPVPEPVVQVQSVPAPAPAPVAAPAPAPVAPSGVAAGLVASAYGQIGVAQDCTAMVENALRSVGIPVGDLAPGQFFAFGAVVGSPAPGDLVITGGHVAIYVGNGQVVSGGLNGMNTGVHSLSDLPGASFVRVG